MLVLTESLEILGHHKWARVLAYISSVIFIALTLVGVFVDKKYALLESLKDNAFWQIINKVCIVLVLTTFAYVILLFPIVLICTLIVVIRSNKLRKEFKRDLKRLENDFPREKTKEYYVRKMDLYYAYRIDELDPDDDQPRWTYYEASRARIELIKICHELYRYVSTLEKRTQNQIYEVLKVAGYLKEAEKVHIYLEMIDTKQ